jgi:glycerol-3-phosphate acyltransferase PlsY
LALLLLHRPDAALLFLLLTLLLWLMHRANISRLLAGGETRIGQK